jgi:DNA repair protein RadC
LENGGGRAIPTWPEEERPREKMIAKGATALGPAELLAILLRTGESTGGRTALDLARDMWDRFDCDWGRLLEATPTELAATSGVGPAKAASVCAALEIARRLMHEPLTARQQIEGAESVWAHFRARISDLTQETFFALYLDARKRLIREEVVSTGSLTESFVHPREAFRSAVREAAASVIFVHNHPSGEPDPSASDIELTRRLVEAGSLLGVPVTDHVIVAKNGYFSFIEQGAAKATEG